MDGTFSNTHGDISSGKPAIHSRNILLHLPFNEVKGKTIDKEGAMKTFVVLGIAVVLSGASLHAQSPSVGSGGDQSPLGRLESYQQCDLQKAEAPLLNSLNHDVEGVVVCALREIAKIKLAQPACTSDPIVAKVDDLVRTGSTPAVRFKAYLTSIVLSNPRFFADEGKVEYQTGEQFFTALARKLESAALRAEG